MWAKLTNPSNLLYDISVSNTVEDQKLSINVKWGDSITLNRVSVTYITYQHSEKCTLFANSSRLVGINEGTSISILSEKLVTTENLLIGLSNLKAKSAFNKFGISFNILPQYYLDVNVEQFVEQLGFAYLGISPKPADVCRNCPSTHISAQGLSTLCEPTCSGYLHTYEGGSTACIECSS